jgi:hypothetical protein
MLSLSSSALQNSFDKVCSVLYLSRPVWRAVEAEVVVEEEVAAVDRCWSPPSGRTIVPHFSCASGYF